MSRFDFTRLNARSTFALCALAAFGLIGAGLVVQSMYRIAPCPLCIFQRLLYVVIGVLAVAGFALPRLARWWAGLLTLVALAGIGVAGQQTWMQAYPHLATECSYTDPNLIERLVDWLGMQWPSLFMATGFCTTRDWEFLGFSIANWSLVAFAAFAATGVFVWRRLARAQ